MGNILAEGRVKEDECVYCRQLGDLPRDLVAVILSLTIPKDIARLACVSRLYRDASREDSVWQKMLPPRYADILAQAPQGALSSTSSKKQVFNYLVNGVLLEHGTQDFWLDRETGGVCRSFGARWLALPDADQHRSDDYGWWFGPCDGARFAETAFVKMICGLQMGGNMKCFLSPGIYVLSWRLSFVGYRTFGFLHPVKFSFETLDNGRVQLKTAFSSLRGDPTHQHACRVGEDLSNVLVTDDNWFEISVGEFTVGRDDLPIEVHFSLTELEGGSFKSGMLIDSVIIRSKSVFLK